MPANTIANIAIICWLSSLALPGIVPYSAQHTWFGFEILLIGWLSPVIGNFAWFANIFILYAFFRLKAGKLPIQPSIYAALISLDTFRLNQVMMNEGGSTTPVYGYGWGAILWLLSIAILLIAVGTQQPDPSDEVDRSGYQWVRTLGIYLTVVILGTSGYFAIYDRIMANPSESQRLASVAFKRVKICSAPEPIAVEPISILLGPLEVVMDRNEYRTINANYPFRQIKDLLSWGIPSVRYYGNDYSLESGSNGKSVISRKAKGGPAAILYVDETDQRVINAKLVEAISKRVVFDQTWEREPLNERTGFHFCPDYYSFPRASDQPRKLLLQSLSISELTRNNVQENLEVKSTTVFEGIVTEETEEQVTRKTRFETWKKGIDPNFNSSVGYMFKSRGDFHEWFNTNCPSDIGWDGSNEESRQHTGWAFMVNGTVHYPTNRIGRNYATCVDDVAYLYIGGMRKDGKYYLNISKRTIPEFRQTWSGIVLIPIIAPPMRENQLEIQSIKEENGLMTLKLIDEDSGRSIVVQVTL